MEYRKNTLPNGDAANEKKSDTGGFKLTRLLAALSVRCLLVLHNILAVWRVQIARDDERYWGLAALNVFIVTETVLVIKHNGGNEWKWWCPCFLSYLLGTLPSIWLLQLSQYSELTSVDQGNTNSSVLPTPQRQVGTTTSEFESVNQTSTEALTTTTEVSSTEEPEFVQSLQDLLELGEKTWIVIIQESLVYLIVFGRWMLPRAEVSRAALSDLLLEYLAMASDIMELYAVFDEDVVQKHLGMTYAILTIWSLSFLQFVPVLANKRKYRHLESPRMKKITRACGEYFAEVVVTMSSIFLQDGPFLCLRLYIMVRFELITYSLVFFVLKNIVALLLLFYRLTILCVRLPCCYYEEGVVVDIEEVDFSRPVILPMKMRPVKPMQLGAF